MNELDRKIVAELQSGIALCERPFSPLAASLGISQEEVVERLRFLVAEGYLSRFAPLFNVERLGGEVTLAALKVPLDRFEEVSAHLNSFREVAHNYEREHEWNMWFVLTTEDRASQDRVVAQIEATTGLKVLRLPKEKEYFLEMRLDF